MRYYGWHPMMGGYNSYGFGYDLIPLGIFVLVLIVFFVLLFKHGKSEGIGKDNQALSILKTRYAKGEIDKKKFEEMKKDIK